MLEVIENQSTYFLPTYIMHAKIIVWINCIDYGTLTYLSDFYTPFQLDEHDFSKLDMMDSRLESRNYYDHIVIFSWTLDSKSGLMTCDLQHIRLITLMCYDKNLHTATQQEVYEKAWRYSRRLNYCYFVVCALIKP